MTPAPLEIENHADGTVRIVWADGHASAFAPGDLRFACRCASCVDEWTGDQRLQRGDVDAAVRSVGMQLVGNYALHITWSDGHSTGIYTWDTLRSLCACAECARTQAPH